MNLTPKRISYLIYKYLHEEITPDEYNILLSWRDKSPENEQYFKQICFDFQQGNLDFEPDKDRMWHSITRITSIGSGRKIRWRRFCVGGIFFVCCFSILLYCICNDRNAVNEDLKGSFTIVGQQEMVMLPDSSVVWLNSNSWLKFLPALSSSRILVVSGEVFFDRIGQTDLRKMIIDISYRDSIIGRLEVAGSRFNVRSRFDDSLVRITLLEGRLVIIRDMTRKEIEPGQQLILNGEHSDLEPQILGNVDTAKIIAWRKAH